MSGQLYNLIMASVPGFYSGDQGEFSIPVSRFLEYTEDAIKGQFQSLDQDAINKLKSLPTMFAVEDEIADARIGKITDIKVNSNNLRAKYRFDKDHYPLTRGILKEHQQKLGIDDFEFHRGHWAVKECDISDFYEAYLKSLTGIAHKLKNTDKKVQLIYAFNGTGKTRLSRALKNLIVPKNDDADEAEPSRRKFLYYNAFTEDLFYWDNDLEGDSEPKLKIQRNGFTDWVLKDQGLDQRVINSFQKFSGSKIDTVFDPSGDHVTFRTLRIYDANGNNLGELVKGSLAEMGTENIKLSKGEESNFIWSIFYTLLDQVIEILNVADPEERETDQFNELEYVFIDDPVSSLDENHLIELAVNLAELIKSAPAHLKFIITTHNPLFYNVLYNEVNSKKCYLLEKFEDGTFALLEKDGDSNKSFSYHLYLKQIIEKAISDNQVEKYHFTLLRNLYEKTASFLGYSKWQDLLETVPGDKDAYLKRIITFSSHRTLSSEEVRDPTSPEKQTVKLLLDNLIDNYGYWPKKEDANGRAN